MHLSAVVKFVSSLQLKKKYFSLFSWEMNKCSVHGFFPLEQNAVFSEHKKLFFFSNKIGSCRQKRIEKTFTFSVGFFFREVGVSVQGGEEIRSAEKSLKSPLFVMACKRTWVGKKECGVYTSRISKDRTCPFRFKLLT